MLQFSHHLLYHTVPHKKRRTISIPVLTDLTLRTSFTFVIEFVVTCISAEILIFFFIARGLCAIVAVFPNHHVLYSCEALLYFSLYVREFLGIS